MQSIKEKAIEKKAGAFISNIENENSVVQIPANIIRLDKLRQSINKVFYLSPNEILLSENVRFSIDKNSEEYISLRNSIGSEGILQPVVVELREHEDSNYELIAVSGHRRIMAAQELGIEKILCVIKKYDKNDDRILHGLTENLMRKDIEPLDIAEGYKKLLVNGWKRDDIGSYFKKDLNYISSIIRIADYPDEIKTIIRENNKKFPMRVLINEFSRKNWKNEDELKEAILKKIIPTPAKSKKLVSNEKNYKNLSVFYQLNNDIPPESKIYIEMALKHFKVI